jgi:riboflavin synthase
MFTGIVEELGTVVSVTPVADGARVVFGASTVLSDARLGDSIAVNGCCLTVVELGDGCWAADAVTETLDRTALGRLAGGERVNLERPVRVEDRLGGHIVQGHVDGVGEMLARDALPDGSTRMRFAVPEPLLRYVVEKGSITLDGVSLTVAAVDDATSAVEIAVIPHTLAVTTLGRKAPGDPVNIEVDVLAKHVERLLTVREGPGERTRSNFGGRLPDEASGSER